MSDSPSPALPDTRKVDTKAHPQVEPLIDPFDDFILHSPSLGKFAEAFSKLQSELPTVKKNKTGKIKGTYKAGSSAGTAYEYEYKYADLEDIVASYRPLLGKHGFMVTQHKKPIERKGYWLITRITHISEEFVQSFYPMKGPESLGQQQHGSETTYARRYEISNLFNIVAEEDDDGRAATSQGNQGHGKQKGSARVQENNNGSPSPAGRTRADAMQVHKSNEPAPPPPSTDPDFVDDGPIEGNQNLDNVVFLSGPFKNRTIKEAWASRVRAIPFYHSLKEKAKKGGTLTPKEIAFMSYGIENKFVVN